ncbi:alpha/beta fold hydrolase [Actinomadura harenae]|uniref:Alpha/beta fold hydrolase n=1 Tax=Actinomadura harenae TaxID=2483351 RepID=A0A3M2M3V7_9ACTN|nr:alpha/beta fold hydrolase [Actinomadura harenae]RMI41808.1 alpha/beta fold hydrolase [Actinomadura harenae]
MRRSRWVTRGVAALAAATATATSLPGLASAAPSAASLPGSATAASAPMWNPCSDVAQSPAQCADIRVPVSWADPRGRDIPLRMSRLPALDPRHRIGTLLFVLGGPGIPSAELSAQQGRALVPAALQDRFDIVGVDPRGVGASAAVKCAGPALPSTTPVFPNSPAQFASLQRQSAAYGTSCVENSTPGLVANVDTVSVARDLDAVRAALGERRLSFLGISYGTLITQTYARLYPDRVRAMALDGAVDHTVGPRALLYDEAASTSRVFARFAAWCSATASCALHGQDVLKVWDDLLARAARTPIPAPNATVGEPTVNDDAIRMALPNLLISGPTSTLLPSSWPVLGEGIARARAGDASILSDNSMAGTPQDAYISIGCQDLPPQLHGYADMAARLKRARALSPHTGGASGSWLVTAACAAWPLPASNPWAPQRITGVPPTLIVSTRNDPSTPLVWAQGLQRQIAGSRLLVAEVTGHLGFVNSACARAEEADYLVTGILPTRTTCGA